MKPLDTELPPGFAPDSGDDELPPGFEEAEPSAPDVAAPAVAGGDDERLRVLFAAGIQQAPDQRAGILELARRTRLPADLVESQYDVFRQKAEEARFDPRSFRETNPELARLVLEDPQAGRVALVDEKLNPVVRALRAASGFYQEQALDEIAPSKRTSSWGFIPLFGDIVDAAARAVETPLSREQRSELQERAAALQAQAEAPRQVEKVLDPSSDLSWWEKLTGRLQKEELPSEPDIQALEAGVGGGGQLWRVKVPGVVEASVNQGTLVLERAELGNQWAEARAAGRDAWAIEKKLADLEGRMRPRFYGADAWSSVLSATGEQLPAQAETYLGAGKVGVGAAAATFAVTRNRQLAGAAARLGGLGGGWLATYRLERGNAIVDYADLRTDAGEKVSDELRIALATVYAAASATIEVGNEFGPALAAAGPLANLVRRGGAKAALADLLARDPAFRRILLDVAKGYAKGVASEMGEEGLQALTQDAIGYLGRAVQGGELQTADVVGSLAGAGEQAVQAGLGRLIPAGGGATAHLAARVAAREAAQRGGRKLAAVIDGAGGATARAAPEFYARLVEAESARDDDPVKALYVDTPQLLRLFQDDATTAAGLLTEEAEKAAAELMGPAGPERLLEAVASGQKLEVPIAEFVESWAPRGRLAEALKPHVSARPWAPTLHEDAADVETREREARAIADAIDRGEAPVGPEEAPLEQLAQDLVATGRVTPEEAQADVRVWRKFLNTTAARSGVPLGELVEQFVVRVEASGGAAGTPALAQGERVDVVGAFWTEVRERAQAKIRDLEAADPRNASSTPEFWAAQRDLERAEGALAGRVRLEQTREPGAPRGWMEVLQEGLRRSFRIVLTERADPSTFLHESAHTFFEILGELASRPTASEQIRADWAAALQFVGAKDRADLQARTEAAWNISSAAHAEGRQLSQDEKARVAELTAPFETWARAFEAYLYEGKAPSRALAGVFQRFKLWLRRIYRSIDALGVQLDDGIRGVFDRLLATDEEIARARRAIEPIRVFRSPADAGMQDDPAAWAAYLERAEKALSAAELAARQRAARERLHETESWWASERATRLEAALQEYDARPAAVAYRFLRSGEAGGNAALELLVKNGNPGAKDALNRVRRVRLDRGAVLEVLGEDGARKLAFVVTEAKAGRVVVSPDDLAELVAPGQEYSGAEMLREMAALPPRQAWAEEQADARMAAEFPDVETEREQLRRIANEELHGDAMLKWLLHEWSLLRQRSARAVVNPETGREDLIPAGSAGAASTNPSSWIGVDKVASIRRAAEILVDRTRVGRLDSGHFLAAERAAAEKAAVAAARRDYPQALVHWQQRMLNHFAFRALAEAREARDELLEQGRHLRKRTSRERLGKASPAFRDAIDQILEALGLAGPFDSSSERRSLREAVAALEASGTTVMFDEAALAALLARPPAGPARRSGAAGDPWKALTVAELRNVLAAVKNIRKAATGTLTALVEGQRLEREDVVAAVLDELARNLPERGAVSSSPDADGAWQSVVGVATWCDGELLKPETMLNWAAAGDQRSMLWKAVILPIQRAKHLEADLLKKTVLPIVKAFDAMPKPVRSRLMERVAGRDLFPSHRADIEPPSRRFELLMMALNAGNESNLERLLEGRSITRGQLMDALGLLTREELVWVQTVWDAAESLWPLARDLEERDSGLAPPKIEAVPLVVRLSGGETVELAGGYFPAVYDRRAGDTVAGERQAAATIASLMDASYTRPGTRHSHLQKRAAEFHDVILLSPRVAQAHLAQVVHDIAFREALKSVGGIVLDDRVQAELKRRLGEQRVGVFLQWLKDIGSARGAEVITHAKGMSRVNRWFRKNFVRGTLGYAADIAFGDLSNLLVGATVIKKKHWAAGLLEAIRSPRETRAWALEKSGELRFRHDHMLEEWRRKMGALTRASFPGREVLDTFLDESFVFMEFMDAVTATPLWIGAYRQGLAETGGDEAAAVVHADAVIRKVFPSRHAADMAEALRSRWLGPALIFYGYLNTIRNLRREHFHDVYLAAHQGDTLGERAISVAKAVPRAAWGLVALAFAYRVVGDLLMRHGPEKDEEFDEWMVRRLLLGATIGDEPIVGPAADALLSGGRASPRADPGFAVGLNAAGAVVRALDGVDDGREFFDLARHLGLALGVPTRPLRAAEYVTTESGREDLRNGRPLDVVGGVVYGPDRER